MWCFAHGWQPIKIQYWLNVIKKVSWGVATSQQRGIDEEGHLRAKAAASVNESSFLFFCFQIIPLLLLFHSESLFSCSQLMESSRVLVARKSDRFAIIMNSWSSIDRRHHTQYEKRGCHWWCYRFFNQWVKCEDSHLCKGWGKREKYHEILFCD